jgi:ornithine decarboxylase
MAGLVGQTISLVEDANVLDIAKQVIKYKNKIQDDDSFFLFNIDDIIWKYNNWMAKLPKVKPHYAVKCNDNEMVLKILEMLGTGFDCASKGEIQKVKALGTHSDRIIYANPTKQISHIKFAKKFGVERMTFDGPEELYKIKDAYPDAKVVLRIRYDSRSVISCLGEKFGCDPITEAPTLINLCKELNLNLIGISFHVGSYSKDFEVYGKAIKAVRELFDYAATVGYDLHLVDIGGGFCGDDPEILDLYADHINQAIDKYFSDPNYEIISEPGRYFVSSAFTCVIGIHSKRIKYAADGTIEHINYYMNDGIYQTFLGYHLDGIIKYPNILENVNNKSGKTYKCTLWGNTCDSIDKIIEDIELPELNIGDHFYFPSVGDYSICISSTFNGFSAKNIVAYMSKLSWQFFNEPTDEYTDSHIKIHVY